MPLLITHLRGCTAALAVPWGSSRKTMLFRYRQPSIEAWGACVLLFKHEARILVAFVGHARDLKQLQCTCILMYHKRNLFPLLCLGQRALRSTNLVRYLNHSSLRIKKFAVMTSDVKMVHYLNLISSEVMICTSWRLKAHVISTKTTRCFGLFCPCKSTTHQLLPLRYCAAYDTQKKYFSHCPSIPLPTPAGWKIIFLKNFWETRKKIEQELKAKWNSFL